ncbi:thiol reductant ABC exporter subunit CydC [Paenibacillus oryzae]|uniref:Thiol reductant ABC exporter subunit CydC n=1 Tax=Paenibacillus oryzae TaxID=1844972 RepID=A0A1A5YEH1_9BACL|nr:thiol reductant ABC exporter subunit CydC [Paenibacillus oryzae]OBR63800.1 thiol reductant ABC exporter subunit CydC [Paenibacillus oryzae]
MNELAMLRKAMLRERRDIGISILCGFVAGIAGIGLFSASGYMISQTVFAPPLYTLIVLTSFVKLLGFLRAGSRYGERLFSHRATFSLLSTMRSGFFAKLIPLMPGLLNKKKSGELLARIVGDVESLQFYFLRVAYPPVIVVMVFLATMLFTAVFSLWIAALFVLGMLITAYGVPWLVLLGQRGIYGRVRRQRAELSADVAELLHGFRDLKVYGRLGEREEELRRASARLSVEQGKAAGRLLAGQTLHVFVTFLISWCVLAAGAWLVANGSLAGVFLAMLVMTAQTGFEEAAAMATLPAYKLDSEYAAKRLAETENEADRLPPQPAAELSVEAAVSIKLDEVSFRYRDEWRPVLKGLSLEIPAGSRVAIVGPSGSGKTTVLELLLKLRTASDGRVLLNGRSTLELREDSIWQASNVVLQHSHFFRGTIRENLLLQEGATERLSDEALMLALNKAQLGQKSLDEEVYEKGENLSQGEKQRLALARAMLRSGRLWLLDEPTSSLDYVTERQVLCELLQHAAGDTLILVCHRLTGLEDMDAIVVMEQGQIVEQGTYEELMRRQGYFYELKKIELQMIGEAG